MEITKEFTFDMGHRVPNHKSKCRNPHGHTYRIQITLKGDVVEEKGISDEGMVMDFSDIKDIAKGFIDVYLDHGFMYYRGDDVMLEFFQRHDNFKHLEVDFIPTAENIAKWIFEALSPLFEDKYGTGLILSKIKLWETPTSFVEYQPQKD